MSLCRIAVCLSVLQVTSPRPATGQEVSPPYPRSPVITGITFDPKTLRTDAPGSDIWATTWAADGHLYTTWGDGGGFGGTNSIGRVSLGIARVEGGPRDYRGVNIAGGAGAPHPAPFTGKSLGILAVGDRLYLWRNGSGSDQKTFESNQLWRSDDHGATWRDTGVRFGTASRDFPPGDRGFYAVAVCQFGKGNAGARDGYVYLYAPDVIDPTHWNIQMPGRVTLMRVGVGRIEDKSAYEFFAGTRADGQPIWTKDIARRRPVWQDERNGNHRMAVSYNPGLKRYLLTTMTVNRDGWLGVYDAPDPWGPWTTVYLARDPELWGTKVIVPTYLNKWLSPDGRSFVFVFTRNDHWATVEGRFDVGAAANSAPPCLPTR